MTNRGLSRLMDYLRRQAPLPPDLVSDGVLLGKYADARDEPSFELVVRRHGPMVWSAVKRILRDEHVAEDALQATFLTLARKANSLRSSDSVAGWLYRVAVRIALRARPRTLPTLPPIEADCDPAIAVERNELIAVVDEEVNRLPERLRLTVVLCCFNGLSTEEAAQRLNCPRGTVLSRLHTARERLRQQLARRGFEAAAVGPLLAQCGPTTLTSTLIAIAVRGAGPATALSPFAITLAQGALTAMFMTKMKIAAVCVLIAGGVGVGAGQWAGASSANPNSGQDKPVAAQSDERKSKTAEAATKPDSIQRQMEMERAEAQERLAKSEKHFWDTIHREQDQRAQLNAELIAIRDDDTYRVRIKAIDTVHQRNLEKLYELKPGRELRVKLGLETEGKADLEIKALEGALSDLERERAKLRENIIQFEMRRQTIENQIKRSELREQLELEKFRKLLK